MAEKIPVRDFENQTLTAVLAGQRYSINLRYNPACSQWMVKISQSGQCLVGFVPLQEGRLILTALPCLPASFGGLYLEVLDTTVIGQDALISGAQSLWFYDSAEVFQLYGTVNP